MQVTLIAALDRGQAIGRAGVMPWHLPQDLKHFKALTLGKPVLMGRKTALSIGRPLPGRRNLVLTRQIQAPFVGQEKVHTLEQAIEVAAGAELMVIGGGEVYALALPYANAMHLTWVDTVIADADTFFPPFETANWIETKRKSCPPDTQHMYSLDFVDYIRCQSDPLVSAITQNITG